MSFLVFRILFFGGIAAALALTVAGVRLAALRLGERPGAAWWQALPIANLVALNRLAASARTQSSHDAPGGPDRPGSA